MKKFLLFFFCIVTIVSTVYSQDPGKKELIVFSLSGSDWNVPPEAFDTADPSIAGVLKGSGRFDVRESAHSIDVQWVPDFIEQMKTAGDTGELQVESSNFGEETFTGTDFQELSEAFLIIIPSLTLYDSFEIDAEEGRLWGVELQVSFTVIRADGSKDSEQFLIETYGSGETRLEAAVAAVEAIEAQLGFEIRNIEEFQLKSGIIEVMDGGTVILDLGSDDGLKTGDEFSVMRPAPLSGDENPLDETGLLVLTNVKENLSYALTVYSDRPLFPGVQLKEISRFGVDVSAYGRGFITADGVAEGVAGMKTVFAGGFWDFRPFAGIEVPVVTGLLDGQWPGFPMTIYGGAELMWYFGRLQIEPAIGLGFTGLIPTADDESFAFTHIGGTASLTVNWMLLDNIRIFAEGGYSYWYSVASSDLTSVTNYGGIFAGLGVTFKL